ncbi:hypothetical protein CAAN2_04S06282 [[Candida] anglica]
MSWLFTEEAFLKQSPSRKQLTIQQDLKTRESIYDFTIKVGSTLKLNGKTILAATVYLARFYMRVTMTTSKYFVVCAALAISCKLNDNYRPPDKIAMTACQIKNPHKRIDESSDVFWYWRDQLLYREEIMLKTLNFDLNLDLPYEVKDELLALPEFTGDKPKVEEEGQEDDLEIDVDILGDVDLEEDKVEEILEKDGPSIDGNSRNDSSQLFYQNGEELLKNAVALVEILSSLPILVTYETRTFLGAALVMVVSEQRLGVKTLPHGFLETHLDKPEECYKCYKYIYKLLKLGESPNPQLASNRAAAKRVPHLDREKFFGIVNK